MQFDELVASMGLTLDYLDKRYGIKEIEIPFNYIENVQIDESKRVIIEPDHEREVLVVKLGE